MIAHKILKVIIGIVLVSTLLLTSAMPVFASSVYNFDVLDYPFYVFLRISSTSDGSSSSRPVISPYRVGNNFYFYTVPYVRQIQWNFYFTDAPVASTPGYAVNSSFSPVSTAVPYAMPDAYLMDIHIENFSIKFTYFAERQVDSNTYEPVDSGIVLKEYNASDSTNTTTVLSFYNADFQSVYSDRFPQHNPLDIQFTSLTGGFDAASCSVASRLFDYPNYTSPFAVRLRVVIDEFIINSTSVAEDQIITEANDEMESIFQRLSDYSLEHLTEVDLNDILNNVDNASNSVEDVRFLSIFDGIYGYGIIPTLITLSLCISFVGYLLFGKSG